jgi:hypothetical protein
MMCIYLEAGCAAWIRTTIPGVKGQFPTVRRRHNELAVGQGFEPQFSTSEADFLPLEEPTIKLEMVLGEGVEPIHLRFFRPTLYR